MSACDLALEALALKPEEGLDPDVRAHLSACPDCREADRDLESLRRMAGREAVSAPEADLALLIRNGAGRRRWENRLSWAGTLGSMAAGLLLGISLQTAGPAPVEAPPPSPSREEIREEARRIKTALAPPRILDRIIWSEPTSDPLVTITHIYRIEQGDRS